MVHVLLLIGIFVYREYNDLLLLVTIATTLYYWDYS